MINLENPNKQDLDMVLSLLKNHYSNTSSEIAKKIITDWEYENKKFIKVMPIEYKAALEKLAKEKINQLIN